MQPHARGPAPSWPRRDALGAPPSRSCATPCPRDPRARPEARGCGGAAPRLLPVPSPPGSLPALRGGLWCLGPRERGWRGLGCDAAPPAASCRRRRHTPGRPSCGEDAQSLRRCSRPGGGGRLTGRGGGVGEDAFSCPRCWPSGAAALRRRSWWRDKSPWRFQGGKCQRSGRGLRGGWSGAF